MEVQQFVSITPWTMIFQICNLLILTLLLKKFLFKPVQNILNRRQQEIDDTYVKAEADRDSAAKMKEEYTRRMSSARDEADLLVRAAVEEANRRGDEIVSGARQTAAGIKRRAEDEIAQERLKAYSELKNDISDMAVEIAGKMVGREINAEDQSRLVEDFIQNAGDDK